MWFSGVCSISYILVFRVLGFNPLIGPGDLHCDLSKLFLNSLVTLTKVTLHPKPLNCKLGRSPQLLLKRCIPEGSKYTDNTYIHWAPKSAKSTYIRLFGSL